MRATPTEYFTDFPRRHCQRSLTIFTTLRRISDKYNMIKWLLFVHDESQLLIQLTSLERFLDITTSIFKTWVGTITIIFFEIVLTRPAPFDMIPLCSTIISLINPEIFTSISRVHKWAQWIHQIKQRATSHAIPDTQIAFLLITELTEVRCDSTLTHASFHNRLYQITRQKSYQKRSSTLTTWLNRLDVKPNHTAILLISWWETKWHRHLVNKLRTITPNIQDSDAPLLF